MYITTLLKSLNARNLWCHSLLVLALLLLGFGAGCATSKTAGDVMIPPPGVVTNDLPPIAIGEIVVIVLTGPIDMIPVQEKQVSEDGTIYLPDIGSIRAAGKTSRQLETEIHDHYVPRYYRHLNITVKTASDRVYFVRGEVKSPGRLIYSGPITVTKAIASAGDFTDFANRHRVYLTRANGQRYKLDCLKILDGAAPDPPVFPNDQIEVAKKIW